MAEISRTHRFLTIGLLLLFGVTLIGSSTGCSCSQDPQKKQAQKKKKDELKKKKKKDFESKPAQVMPSGSSVKFNAIKPGHWFNASQQIKANNFPFLNGELECFAARNNQQLFAIRDTNYQMRVTRPAALPKGQSKAFDLLFFAPTTHSGGNFVSLFSKLNYKGGGTRYSNPPLSTMVMRSFQNYLVVLCPQPERYTFLKTLQTVFPTSASLKSPSQKWDYFVVLPKTDRGVALPSNSFAWTSIAYIVWDELDSVVLTQDQQQAMLDWLHWGGQLIVSGPDSYERLRTSFLAKYIPAKVGEPFRLDEDAISPLRDSWTVGDPDKNLPLRLLPDSTLEAVQMEPQNGGRFVGNSGKLVAESRVGRGRIVMTAFRLNAREFNIWSGYDNLFNNTLFRRAPREFVRDQNQEISVIWANGIDRLSAISTKVVQEDSFGSDPEARVPYESLLTSKMRYFSRDAKYREEGGASALGELNLDVDGYGYDRLSGNAGWSDNSYCANVVRQALNDAGGIEVPNANFILAAMGMYLVVLVPANWIIFRTIDRVEWAWFAVPFIAIGGTFFVVKMAQLDIGFARSRTEICILETQPGHSRAHLTRYTGLYTSLSTSYRLGFADSSSLSLPFASERRSGTSLEGRSTVTLRLGKSSANQDSEVQLDGFSVTSNATGMIHSEEMIDLGGTIFLTQEKSGLYSLKNDSDFTVKDVGLVGKFGDTLKSIWFSEIGPKQFKTFHFSQTITDGTFSEWESVDIASKATPEGEIGLRDLFTLALDPLRLNDGDFRMVGWTDQEMPGLKIRPSSSQKNFRTVFVCNLRYGDLPTPMSDKNAIEDFKKPDQDEEDDGESA